MTALLTARDRRAVTGRNCALLMEETRLNIWMENKTKVKEVLAEKEKTEVPLGEEWRVEYLSKQLEQRQPDCPLQRDGGGREETVRTHQQSLHKLIVMTS